MAGSSPLLSGLDQLDRAQSLGTRGFPAQPPDRDTDRDTRDASSHAAVAPGPPSSCPDLIRASMGAAAPLVGPSCGRRGRVDGRIKSGHDVGVTAGAEMQMLTGAEPAPKI